MVIGYCLLVIMDRLELQKLRDLPIEGVAERLGLQVTRHKCLCPFHDDHHASLSFKVSKNTFRCFVCGASGGPIDLVMKYLNKDFRDACRWLADENNIIVSSFRVQDSCVQESKPFDAQRYARFFERPWLNDEARKFLFDERRLDPRVVRWCRLTSWKDKQGVPWLQTPYYDREGKLIGIQNRNLAYNREPITNNCQPITNNREPITNNREPRFRFPPGSQCSLYGLPVLNLLKPGETLFIAEGCSDCWSLLSAGHKAIAIPSATLLGKKDKEILSTLHSQLSTKFGMWPDNDAPGERLFLQLKEVLPSLVRHQLPAGCKDFSDYYLKLRVKN